MASRCKAAFFAALAAAALAAGAIGGLVFPRCELPLVVAGFLAYLFFGSRAVANWSSVGKVFRLGQEWRPTRSKTGIRRATPAWPSSDTPS